MPQLKPTRGIRLNKSHPLARGLVGCWLFNEGSGNKVFDLSGNGHNGTRSGSGNIWATGRFASAQQFNGTDDSIDFGSKYSLKMTDALTIILWVKRVDDTTFERFISHSSGVDSYAYEVGVDFTNPDQWRFRLNDDAVTVVKQMVGSPGDWIQLACTYDKNAGGSTEMKLYENASLLETGDYSTALTNHGNLQTNRTGKADGFLKSAIDNIATWNRALSSSEIALLYREPFCMFERAWIPKLIGSQIVNLAGSSVALSSLSATAKAMRKVGGNVVSTTDVTAILNLFCSLLYIESNWKREALFNGMTANAFKLGTTLSLGWFWVRVAGCSVLYRGSSMGEIDFVNILAVAEQDACEISPPSYISHNSGSTYFYVVRRFNNCGYQECTLSASVKVSIESTGELAKPQPNKVFDSVAELIDGNKIKLVWYYCPLEQKSQPMCFNVYYDGRSGQINYENPLAIIGYKGRKFYSYQCGALEAGRYLFAIRTEDASGKENSSLARLRIQFNTTNSDAIDILSAEGV